MGTLPDDEWQTVADHLQGCTDCSALVESLADSRDDLVGWLRELKGSAEPSYQAAGGGSAIEFDLLSAAEKRGTTSLPPGTCFREYRLVERIGEGGMGAVYKAVHTRLDRLVALKVLGDERMHRPEALARFQREMKAVGKINHPNVVQATDAGEANGTHFLVMELVEGCDTARLLRTHGPLSVADACEIVRQASLGLANIQQHGLIHRDIKPSNLILASGGTVKILDLGLALLQETQQAREGTTTAGLMLGSFDYMAPEQADDPHAVDLRADLYSLGCTLFQLLTGQPPFPAPRYKTPLQKMKAHESEPPPDLQKLCHEVPRELAQLVARLLAKEPQDRFASASEVAAALQPFVAGSDLAALAERALGPLARTHQGPDQEQLDAPAKAAGRVPASPPGGRRWLKRGMAATALAGILLGIYIYAVAPDRRVKQVPPRRMDKMAANLPVTSNAAPAKEAEPAWTALFNGKDLTGWQPLPNDLNSWSVENGVLVGQGPAPSNLYTERGDFKDFHLRVEANMNADEDSGVFFRIPFDRLRGRIPYEAQIVGWRQDQFNTGGMWGFIQGRVTEMLVRPGDWFTLEVIARGNHLIVKVDGHTTLDFTDEMNTYASGHIAVQHFRSEGVIRFRKIEIQELPAATVAPVASLHRRTIPDADVARSGNGDGDHAPKGLAALLRGHKSRVITVNFRPDGKTLASGGEDNNIILWDLTTNEKRRLLEGHQDDVRHLAFSRDGTLLASGSADHTIKLWNAETGAELHTLRGHSDMVHGVAFVGQKKQLASVAHDRLLKLWDLSDGHELASWLAHEIAIGGVDASADGRWLATAGDDGAVKLWDLKKQEPVLVQRDHAGPASRVVFLPGNRGLASGGRNGRILVWDYQGESLGSLNGHQNWVLSLAVTSDGKRLASSSTDGTARLWDLTNMQSISIDFLPFRQGVEAVAFSPDGRYLATGNPDGSVYVMQLDEI